MSGCTYRALTPCRSVSALTEQLDDFALRQFSDNACEALSDIDKAHVVAAASRPELVSKIWKSIEDATDRLNNIPLSELDALRAGDAVRAEKFNALLEALQRVRTETKVKH